MSRLSPPPKKKLGSKTSPTVPYSKMLGNPIQWFEVDVELQRRLGRACWAPIFQIPWEWQLSPPHNLTHDLFLAFLLRATFLQIETLSGCRSRIRAEQSLGQKKSESHPTQQKHRPSTTSLRTRSFFLKQETNT